MIGSQAMLKQIEELIGGFVTFSKEILKDCLTGIYLHGSAAMGCYHPQKSDLDFLVVVNEPMTDAVKRIYMDNLFELDTNVPGKGIEMSIVLKNDCDPFIYPTPYILHYSRGHKEWYKSDPEDYIQRMNGTDKDLAAHFTMIRNRGCCLYGLPIQKVFGMVPEQDYLDSLWYDVSNAEKEITENPMYLILNLARVLAYLKEKKILSKREGGAWGLEHLPDEYHPLIRSALREYECGAVIHYDDKEAEHYAAYMLRQISRDLKK